MAQNDFVLENIHKKRWCRITKPLGTLRYEVRAQNGRRFKVFSDVVWPVGVMVDVVKDRIVSRSKNFSTFAGV